LARVARLELSENDEACLRAIVKKGLDWRERERAETILLLASGASVKAIVKQQRISCETVRVRRCKWLESGLASMPTQPRSGAPSKLADEHREQIQQWVEAEALSSRCILSRLKEKYQIEISATTLRTELKRLGFVWKRTRYSLKKSAMTNASNKPSATSRN